MATLDIIKGTSTDPKIISYQVLVKDDALPEGKDYRFAVEFDLTASADERLQKISEEGKRYINIWKTRAEVIYPDDDIVVSTQIIPTD